MTDNPYKLLAERLDALPNGFPATEDGAELRLLEKLCTPEEAALAAQMRLTLETPRQIAERLGMEERTLRQQLKAMLRKGLLAAGRSPEGGLGYRLLPFVVGIYEMQLPRMDAELAQLVEAYFQRAFGGFLQLRPQIHRVIPVQQSVRADIEVQPFESVAGIVAQARSWGVMDCLCRKQQALIGKPCNHPIDVCMIFSDQPGAYEGSPYVRALTQEEALATLRRAAEAGLVHSVSNTQEGTWYVCNCCTCACGIMRGMVELGIANVVARSSFINVVDEARCIACGACVDVCPFGALSLDGTARVDPVRCTGCGVCTLRCPQDALSLVARPADEVSSPPRTERDWQHERATARGIDLDEVL
ncbi:MAG: 4Fe-4S binding protein [Anaerolineae bacterium]|nr:4Fe-4S binding protein [Anaerolineae bacterium]